MSTMASQITGVPIVYSTVCTGADQRKHQSSTSLVFVRGIHRWPVNSLHKGPVTWKVFQFDDVIMNPCKHIWFFSQCWNMVTAVWLSAVHCDNVEDNFAYHCTLLCSSTLMYRHVNTFKQKGKNIKADPTWENGKTWPHWCKWKWRTWNVNCLRTSR